MKQEATRNGTTVSLPKYCNAEMLMLEFFSGQQVAMQPVRNLKRTKVIIYQHVDILDQLLTYINNNI